MIILTRLSGSTFALNADLIERIDATPDTVVTLVDGKKYVVTESMAEIVVAVRRHCGEILALSATLQVEVDPGPTQHPRLGTVTEHPSSRAQLSHRTEH